jgi:hypothetical protein
VPTSKPHLRPKGKPDPIKLTPDEIKILLTLREKPHQEVVVKVQDGTIVCIKRIETWTKKKGRFI